MQKSSHPIDDRGDIRFTFSADENQLEDFLYLSEDFPIAMYTQTYLNSALDHIPFHWHNEYQIIWVSKGELDYCVSGDTFPLNRSNLLFINRQQLHSSKPAVQDVKTLCINFHENVFHPVLWKHYISPVLENPSFTYTLLPLKPHHITRLEQFMKWNEKLQGYFSIMNFLSQLAERIVQSFDETKTDPVDSEEMSKMNLLLEFVHTHYAEPITVKDIADVAHINKNQLTALFHKYTNLSPMKYVNNYRLYEAKTRIVNTRQPLSIISEDVGYNQQSYFIQQFKEMYKLTPLKYRNKYGRI